MKHKYLLILAFIGEMMRGERENFFIYLYLPVSGTEPSYLPLDIS